MSTLIVAGTLIVNAGAVLNFKLSKNKDETFGEEVSQYISFIAWLGLCTVLVSV